MRYAVSTSIDRAIDVETRRFNQSIREAYLFLLLAVSLGVNIGLLMTRQAFQDRPIADPPAMSIDYAPSVQDAPEFSA